MSDTSRHLTYFKVENFKRFESFEMKDLGQFNLIVGDNNVGKTSVLEALLVEDYSWDLASNFIFALAEKNIYSSYTYSDLDFFINNKHGKAIGAPISKLNFYLNYGNRRRNIIWEFDWVNQQLKIQDDILSTIQTISFRSQPEIVAREFTPFITSNKWHDFDLVTLFSEEIQRVAGKRTKLIEGMKTIISDLIDIEPSTPKGQSLLTVITRGQEVAIPLAFYGEGTIKLLRLLIKIITHSGELLMIDEISTGIHYSRLKIFWKTILLAAKDNNIQLFMTTHSKECIQAFVEALSEPDMKELSKDARNITLIEEKDKSIKAFSYPFDELEHAITVGNEVRS